MFAYLRAGLLVVLALSPACRSTSATGPAGPGATASPGAPADPAAGDYQAIYEALETAIADGSDTEDDRQDALEAIRRIPDDGSAGYAFARAAILGRVAELRGIKAGKLVTEAEKWAKASIDRDREYRDFAASRMLGTLWVMAPARLVEHGDSEDGLALLEALADAYPEVVENHLRVAEAYVFLGDPDPAVSHLCSVRPRVDALRPDDRALFGRLVEDVADGQELACEGAG